jgi:alkylation response protein AidB-like acyl-CoA dehydrogenase
MKLLADEVGILAAEAIGRIVANADRVLDRSTLTLNMASLHDVWVQLSGGGWDRLMLESAKDGGGADLVDLLPVAETWGRYLVPLPFLETVVLRRWTRDDQSLSDRRLTGLLTNGIAAFGREPDVLLLIGVDPPRESELVDARGECDGFAPSLPLAITKVHTELPSECIREMTVLSAATAVGAASMVLERTVEYAKTREAFGRTIGHFQAVKHRLANMHVDLELARTAMVWAAQDASSCGRPLASAAVRAQRVAAGAIQLHGGTGFTWDAGVHRYMRHVLAVSKLIRDTPEGTSDSHSTPSTPVEERSDID